MFLLKPTTMPATVSSGTLSLNLYVRSCAPLSPEMFSRRNAANKSCEPTLKGQEEPRSLSQETPVYSDYSHGNAEMHAGPSN